MLTMYTLPPTPPPAPINSTFSIVCTCRSDNAVTKSESVFFRWEFFFRETATAQENLFFVINWKTSRCEARTWRDVINEFEIDL